MKMFKLVRKAGSFAAIILTVGLFAGLHGPLVAQAAAAGKAIRVAVYEPKPNQTAKGLIEELKAEKSFSVESIADFSAATLAKLDVLVFPWNGAQPANDPDWPTRLRQWVRDGHGLMVTHDRVGFRNCEPIFSEIAVGTGNPFGIRIPYDKEICVAREHPLSQGFAVRDRVPLAYYDYITIAPGPAGVVVFRGVERMGKFAVSSAPAVVCGAVGKGRYVACGAIIGNIAPRGAMIRPVGGEALLLINSVKYLAGQGQDGKGEDIGGGLFLGSSHIDYACNGSLENGATDGWKMLDGSAPAKLEIVKDAKDGKFALAVSAAVPGRLLLANIKPGPFGQPGQFAYPDSGYNLHFWVRANGAKAVGFTPALLVWKEGVAPDAAPELVLAEKELTTGEAWVEHTLFVAPPESVARVAVAFVMEAAQAGEGLLLDGLQVNRKDIMGLQGVSAAALRARCEIPFAAQWTDASNDRPLNIINTPENTLLVFPEKQMTLPRYNRWHEEWEAADLGGAWKVMKLADTEQNPADDAGTRAGYFKTDFDDSKWPSEPVPAIGRHIGVGWYRHWFEVPAGFAGKRIILHFANVYKDIAVYVNGEKAGKAESMHLPCEFDVTALAKPGRNLLAVRIHAPESYFWGGGGCGGLMDEVTLQARPPVYLKQALITRYPETNSIDIDMKVFNSGAAPVTAPLTIKVSPSAASLHLGLAGGKEQTFDLGEKTFAPGESACAVTLALDKPVEWLPENPYLYEMRFVAGGMPLGKERFGMSAFSVKENLFLLNGRQTRLPGQVFKGGVMGGQVVDIANYDRAMKQILLSIKRLGKGTLLPQGQSAVWSQYFRDLCDELGLMIFEWPGIHPPDPTQYFATMELLASKEFMQPWLEKRYNHPSYIMTSLGNETRNPIFLDVLNRAYDTLSALDKQKRPICTITGGNPSIVPVRTDVEDFHFYAGEISGHPLDTTDQITDYNEMVWRYQGKVMPVINYEMGGNRCVFLHNNDLMTLRHIFLDKPEGYKQMLIDLLEAGDPGYEARADARWVSLYGMRRYAVDDFARAQERGYIHGFTGDNKPKQMDVWPWRSGVEFWRLMWCVKWMGEQNRLLGDLFGGGGYNWWWSGTAHNLRYKDSLGKEVIEPLTAGILPRIGDGDLLTNLANDTFKRVHNPVFICAAPFNLHPISGKPLRASLYAINDLLVEDGPWVVHTVVRAPSGIAISRQRAELPKVPSLKRLVMDWEWNIPTRAVTGAYKLELFLLDKQNKVLSDNDYTFYVFNSESDLAATVDNRGKRVALYDVGERAMPPGSLTTAQMTERLKFKCDRIDDFESLHKYDVLFIGRNSMDVKVEKAGAKIRQWLEAGHRLVQFEQASPGQISFIPQLNVIKSYGGAVADLVVVEHPLFEGLQQTDLWDMWAGPLPEANIVGRQGGIFSCLIGPLNRSALAVGQMRVARESNKAVQMLVSEVRVGKGSALLSQAEATRRFGEDAVATRYLENLLRYAVGGDDTHAESITGLDIKNLDVNRFGYLDIEDLKKTARPLAADWRAKLSAATGVPEFGNLLFKNLGDTAAPVAKDAPFLAEFEQRSKLMFPEWEAEKIKKDRDQRGLMLRRAEAVYLLYSLSGNVVRGERIGKIIFSYADGATVEEKLEVGYNIGLPGDKGELDHGRDAGEGYTIARWINPAQEKEIVAVRIEVTHPSAQVAVLGLSTYLMREKVHD